MTQVLNSNRFLPPIAPGWFFDGYHSQIGFRMTKKFFTGDGEAFVSVKCRFIIDRYTGEVQAWNCQADRADCYGLSYYRLSRKMKPVIDEASAEIEAWLEGLL